MSASRPIEVRLAEYAKTTRGLIPQLKGVLARVPEKPVITSSHQPLSDAIRFYGLIADDLDKILAGEELGRWRIEGVLPDTSEGADQ